MTDRYTWKLLGIYVPLVGFWRSYRNRNQRFGYQYEQRYRFCVPCAQGTNSYFGSQQKQRYRFAVTRLLFQRHIEVQQQRPNKPGDQCSQTMGNRIIFWSSVCTKVSFSCHQVDLLGAILETSMKQERILVVSRSK